VVPDEALARPRRLSYRERLELEGLPGRIEGFEGEKAAILGAMSQPDFYAGESAAIASATRRLHELEEALAASYVRWQELDDRSSSSP
jgi:ATP-binding cassette subfamily F protein uup